MQTAPAQSQFINQNIPGPLSVFQSTTVQVISITAFGVKRILRSMESEEILLVVVWVVSLLPDFHRLLVIILRQPKALLRRNRNRAEIHSARAFVVFVCKAMFCFVCCQSHKCGSCRHNTTDWTHMHFRHQKGARTLDTHVSSQRLTETCPRAAAVTTPGR